MQTTTHAHPFGCDLGDVGPPAGVGRPADPLRACLLRHLVIAAEEIGCDRSCEPDAPRYVAIAARLRDMGFEAEGGSDGPWIEPVAGRPLPLLGLLAEAWEERRGRLPVQGVDPELLEASVELLRGLSWHISDGRPGQQSRDGRGLRMG